MSLELKYSFQFSNAFCSMIKLPQHLQSSLLDHGENVDLIRALNRKLKNRADQAINWHKLSETGDLPFIWGGAGAGTYIVTYRAHS